MQATEGYYRATYGHSATGAWRYQARNGRMAYATGTGAPLQVKLVK